jgi:PAS domain S-box-containing protein
MNSDFFGPAKRNQWLVVAGLTLSAGLIFAADLVTTHGYTVWVLYLPLCVGAAWSDYPREAIIASVTATLLIAAGWVLSPEPPPILPGIVSRTFEALTIWLAVLLILFRRRSARATEIAYQEARDASDRLNGIILNNAEDAIVCVDEAQSITLFNRGAERIFGYTAVEAIDRPLSILLPGRATSSHANYVRDFGVSPVQSRRMGERGTVTGARKDGSEFPAEISISKLPTATGNIYTAVVRDVTERMKTDELFRERERRLRIALSAGRMGTFDVDEVRGVLRQDETADTLLDVPPGRPEFPLSDFFDRVHPGDRDAVRARHERLRLEGGDYLIEFRVTPADGNVRWLSAHGYCELDANGKARRTTGVLRDVTERKLAEEVLEARIAERTASLREEIERREEAQAALLRSQKLQAVGELAGGMAHDFNNLLTVINGNLELLGLRQLDDKARDLLRRAEEAATMGGRLANRLLVIGRRQRLQPVTLDLNEVARSMTDILRRTLGDQIEIQATFASDLWPTLADISEVENAILNLAINARDAMPNGGKLFIQTTNKSLGPDDVAGEAGLKPGEYVMLSINDTGTGIPPEHLTRVFEPYFTTKEAGRGTGLGLSTIYGFAKQSGGHLTIYSEVGRGTSVRLYLPRAAAGATTTEHKVEAPARAAGQAILVVEDNADVRDVTVKRLDMLGYRVLTAENGPSAIALLEGGTKVDLVFSDVMMPGGMTGFDVVRWVRANQPGTKVLLTSGFTGEVAKNGERAGAADVEVLRKPYAIAELARAVREALG